MDFSNLRGNLKLTRMCSQSEKIKAALSTESPTRREMEDLIDSFDSYDLEYFQGLIDGMRASGRYVTISQIIKHENVFEIKLEANVTYIKRH